MKMVLEKLCFPTFFETSGWKRIFGIQEMILNLIYTYLMFWFFIKSISIPFKQVFNAFNERIEDYELVFTESEDFEEHIGGCNCLLVQLQWTNEDGLLDRGRHVVVLTASKISEAGKLVFSAIDSIPNSEIGDSSQQKEETIEITAEHLIEKRMLYSIPYQKSKEYAFLEKSFKLKFSKVENSSWIKIFEKNTMTWNLNFVTESSFQFITHSRI